MYTVPMKTKKKSPRKPRDPETLAMILGRKGGPMRDRRLRRPKDTRHTHFEV